MISKEIMVMVLINLFFFYSFPVKAQYLSLPDSANFYDYLNAYYNSSGYNPNDTSEGGGKAQHERLVHIWGPRLYPHGDFSIANKAIIEYAQNYTPVNIRTENPNWVCIGPSDNPKNSDSYGVGQIHRITFDPNYNGTTNMTIYACSGYGGLWRTENDGELWEIVNTDALPMTSVGDIAISPTNSDVLFISTGHPDGGLNLQYSPNWGSVNPISTIGIYRSENYGATWHTINSGFIGEFYLEGGTVRKLTINPNNPNVLFAATSKGIFRTENALATIPVWQNVLSGSDFRSVEFKPDSSSVVYASSTDIFKSTNGGDTWASMTGVETGLDFDNMGSFYPFRINLAVTPANPDKLFAYIWGDDETIIDDEDFDEKSVYIYIYDDSLWSEYIYYHGYNDLQWMGFAVSPIDEDMFFAYGDFVENSPDWAAVYGVVPGHGFMVYANYWSPGTYADGHVLAFQPNVSTNPKIFNGHHAGISVLNVDLSNKHYEYRNNGLQNQLIWSFDDSEFEKDVSIIANQDCFVYVNSNGEWNSTLYFSDGYSAKFSKTNNNLFFTSYDDKSLYSHNKLTGLKTDEYNKKPFDGRYPNNSALITKTFQVRGFPNDTCDYFGFSEIYKRNYDLSENHNSNDLWEIDSDLGKTNGGLWMSERQITEFDYCQSEPNVIYLATGGVFSSDPSAIVRPMLFKTTVGGNNGDFTDVGYEQIDYPGINETDFPVISGIAVHPFDPDKVWISMIGYDNIEIRVAYSIDGGETWNNADPNNSLPELPINNIVYQYGSNDLLYIATDVGIFYKDASMSDWEEYGVFPHVRVTELKINYCQNKLRAATFGRSLWEGDLITSENPVCYTIKDNETLVWSKQKALQTGIRIEDGGELIIQDLVNMPANSKIIVEPGGKLTIDGGTLTNGCGEAWQGIEVWGQSQYSQNPSYQGLVEITNGGTIENAIIGILANKGPGLATHGYTGGIVLANGAIFKNNVNDIVFSPYNYTTMSVLSDCQFITDDNWPHQGAIPESHIRLIDYQGLHISGCTFINEEHTLFNTVNLGIGILSTNSAFTVKYKCLSQTYPCTKYLPTSFTNLYYGIYAMCTTSERTFSVQYAEFDCYRGIFNSAVDNTTVILNTFTVPPTRSGLDASYGLYLDNSTGYQVEGNEFTGTGLGVHIGLYVNNSGTDDNLIYNNIFSNLSTASAYQDINRNYLYGGLEVKCNDYSNNGNDVIVVMEDTYVGPNHGIAKSQGYIPPPPNQADPTAPAGNTFSNYSGHAWDIYNEGQGIVYIYHNEQSAYPLKVRPALNYGNVSTSENRYANYSKESACPPTFGGGGIGELKSLMLLAENSADSTLTELAALTDGGDTEGLSFEVAVAMPGDEIETRDILIQESPDLSDTVMVAAIEKEEVLPTAMVRDVLVENPQAAKSVKIQEALNARSNQLPQYMRNQIDLGRDTLSQKELLEANLAYYQLQKSMAFNQLHNLYRSDTLVLNLQDSLEQLYVLNTSLENQYRLAMLKLINGDTTQPFTILSNIQDDFELTAGQEDERQAFNSYFNIIRQMKKDSLQMPDSSAISSLQSIYQDAYGIPAVYARNMLVMAKDITYTEPILLPDSTLKMSRADNQSLVNPEQNTSGALLILKPNPANDYVIAEWKLPETAKNPRLVISTIEGRIIGQIQLQDVQNEKVISVTGWKPGTYIVTLVADGKKYDNRKLEIVK